MIKSLNIFIIAGEASGDKLGGGLIRSLKKQCDDCNISLNIDGIGGRFMQEQGLESLFPMRELSLMGFVEVLPHIRRLKKRIVDAVVAIESAQPDILITIDSPGFCNRVVKKLRENGKLSSAKFLHYVAPSVWAYKPKRAEKMAKIFDELMVLFPFEPQYFEKHGLKTHFVGHPIVDEPVASDEQAMAFKQEHEIDNAPLLVAFAGSRAGELGRMLPIFGKVMQLIREQQSDIKVVLPVLPNMENKVREMTENWLVKPIIITDELDKKAAIKAANVALVKSGTITLEVACSGTPMVTTYKANPISVWALRRMAIIPYVNLVNVIHGRFVIQELLQEDCTPLQLSEALLSLLQDEKTKSAQIVYMKEAISQLHAKGEGSGSDNAASVVLKLY